MMFTDERIKADFMSSKSIEKYLAQKLQETLGFEYAIHVRTHIGRNWLSIEVDKTKMRPDSYAAYTRFTHKHNLADDLELLSYFLNQDCGGNYSFEYLVTSVYGAYIVRQLEE